jgi:hypothetical protein
MKNLFEKQSSLLHYICLLHLNRKTSISVCFFRNTLAYSKLGKKGFIICWDEEPFWETFWPMFVLVHLNSKIWHSQTLVYVFLRNTLAYSEPGKKGFIICWDEEPFWETFWPMFVLVHLNSKIRHSQTLVYVFRETL